MKSPICPRCKTKDINITKQDYTNYIECNECGFVGIGLEL